LDDSPKLNPGLFPRPCKKRSCETNLLYFLVRGVLAARITELLRFQTFGMLLLVFRRCVVAVFAIAALQRNDLAHRSQSFRALRAIR
jgi:hypothetical protein